MRGNEIVNKQRIRCYDSGGPGDRYTVVYMDGRYRALYACVGMSAAPFHPQGIGQHSSAMLGKHLGKRIPFNTLPADCQKLVMQDLWIEEGGPNQ